ncbi:MAG: hypothetical protein MRY83_14795 [Flavobacteriales bacterium]|nr:hypothetical protein [Flavobacteriales bacterium]
MKKEFKFFWIGLGLASILWLILFVKTWNNTSDVNSQIITDTIYVDRPYEEIVIQKVEVPQKVFIYRTDTVFRKKIELDTLITGIKMTSKMAQIHTITSKGIPKIKEYSINQYNTISINHRGQLQIKNRKKPKLRRVLGKSKQFALVLGGVFLGKMIFEK